MPIFFIGTQRCGSNLLRVMLDQSPRLAAPHPPHILQRITPLLPLYGDLAQEPQFAQLVDDVCTLVEHNPVPWASVLFDRDAIRRSCRNHTLLAVMEEVYRCCMQANDADDWVCKSMACVKFTDEINSHFNGDCKFIHMYRDGRDVALSFQKAVIGEKHAYFIARQWHQDQQRALAFCREHQEQSLSLSYENLILNTVTTLQSICRFLEIPFDKGMLSYYNSNEAIRTANSGGLWSNVARPLMKSNSGDFEVRMSRAELEIFEAVAGASLDSLGYSRKFDGCRANGFSEDEIASFQSENEAIKADFTRQHQGSDELKKRAVQDAVIENIKARYSAVS